MSKLNAFITVSKRALLLFSMIKSKKVHTSMIFVLQDKPYVLVIVLFLIICYINNVN